MEETIVEEKEYHIGDIVSEFEYTDAVIWCRENNALLVEVGSEDEIRKFEIVAIPEPTIEEQNEKIRNQRQERYVKESDPIRLDYDEAFCSAACFIC